MPRVEAGRARAEMSETADKPQSVTERLLDISTAGVWPQFTSLLRGIKSVTRKVGASFVSRLGTLVIGPSRPDR